MRNFQIWPRFCFEIGPPNRDHSCFATRQISSMLLSSSVRNLNKRAAPLFRRAISSKSIDIKHADEASLKSKLPKEELVFGKTFTDHILEIDWNSSSGWSAPQIKPFGDLQIHPAASSLHYGLQCFEGMKAYVDKDGEVRLFRPDKNMERMNTSCERLFLPKFDGEELVECIKELIKVDRDWIPEGEGFSLYIRPTAISTHPYLGVTKPDNAKIFVILSPVGPYYPEGFAPVKLFADNQNVRAWPGGIGYAKAGGNYAPTIGPQATAAAEGYSQVLWLYGEDDQVTEVGTMNMITFWINEDGEKELVTAPLDGTILPGVTRDSILQLARDWGEFKVSERNYTMPELAKALDEGRVLECFGAGTAAVVSSIEMIGYNGKDYQVPLSATNPDQPAGDLTMRVWNEICGIQYGEIESDWSVKI
jgi:branched-chain amino acid aminotransferase